MKRTKEVEAAFKAIESAKFWPHPKTIAAYARELEGRLEKAEKKQQRVTISADAELWVKERTRAEAAEKRVKELESMVWKMSKAMTDALNLMGGPTMDYSPEYALEEWRKRWSESCDKLIAALRAKGGE